MNITVSFLRISLVLVVPFLGQIAHGAAPPSRSLRAGAAAVDITPTKFPINMPGGFNANMAEKANDPLHARALVLDDGRIRIALVLVDNLGLAREVIDEAKLLITRRCRLLPEHILISATHTHSAPPAHAPAATEAEVAYRKLVIKGIVDSVARAEAALRPAAVGTATHSLPDEVFNRRWFLKPGEMPINPFGGKDLVKMNPGTDPKILLHPAGPTDPDVTILSVQEARSKKPLALYANYSLHYVGGTPRAMVSADYFGEFARLMPTRLGAKDGFVAMLTNGTSGDINNVPFGKPRPPRETFEQIRIVAGKTADAAWHARRKIETHRTDVRITMIQRELTLRMRRPTAEQIAEAKAILDIKDESKRAKLPRLAEHYARRLLTLAKSEQTLKAQLQAVRLGDFVICAIPFEVFAEIGLELKRRSPFERTMVVGLANGYNGYLPTPEQHKLGGYETWMGTNRVQEDASVLITKELLAMLAKLEKMK